MTATPTAEPPEAGSAPRFGIGTKILIGMIVGAGAGAVLGPRVEVLEPVGEIFIRLLMAAAIPLVVFNLLAGLTTLTELRTFGRLAGKIVVYYTVTTTFALGHARGAVRGRRCRNRSRSLLRARQAEQRAA